MAYIVFLSPMIDNYKDFSSRHMGYFRSWPVGTYEASAEAYYKYLWVSMMEGRGVYISLQRVTLQVAAHVAPV